MKEKPISILTSLKAQAEELIRQDPDICERLGYPGHYSGIYRLQNSKEGWVEGVDDNLLYDATSFWMTLPIDINYWFGNEKNLVREIGLAALRCGTMSEFATSCQALFLKKISEYFPRAERVLTYTAGTLAVDALVKWMFALTRYKHHLQIGNLTLVVCQNAFHGRAGYPAELTRLSQKTEDWQTGWAIRIPDPLVIYSDDGELLPEKTRERVSKSLEELERAFKRGPQVAGLLIEYPIEAEGGVLVVAKNFLEEARLLCDKYDKILAIDSVQMFGRGWPIHPKIVELADGAAIGKISRLPAAILSNLEHRGFDNTASIPGKFGATWAGLESQFLAALAIFKIIEENNLYENGKKESEYLYQQLKTMAKSGKAILRPRIAGTYTGFDLPNPGTRQRLVDVMREKYKTLLLPAGDTAIRISPRLDAKRAEIDFLLSSLEAGLRQI